MIVLGVYRYVASFAPKFLLESTFKYLKTHERGKIIMVIIGLLHCSVSYIRFGSFWFDMVVVGHGFINCPVSNNGFSSFWFGVVLVGYGFFNNCPGLCCVLFIRK